MPPFYCQYNYILKLQDYQASDRELPGKHGACHQEYRRSTVTGIIKLIEQKGYITRTSVESDARLKQLVPTEKAEALRPRIVEHIKKCEAALSAGIPDDKLHVCREVLCQMLDNLATSK